MSVFVFSPFLQIFFFRLASSLMGFFFIPLSSPARRIRRWEDMTSSLRDHRVPIGSLEAGTILYRAWGTSLMEAPGSSLKESGFAAHSPFPPSLPHSGPGAFFRTDGVGYCYFAQKKKRVQFGRAGTDGREPAEAMTRQTRYPRFRFRFLPPGGRLPLNCVWLRFQCARFVKSARLSHDRPVFGW